MLELFKIWDCGLPKCRYGNQYDGGYVIADGLDYDYFLSCGIGGNITFEFEFIKDNPIIGKSFFDADLIRDEITKEKLRLIPDLNFYWLKINSETNLHEYLRKYKNIFLKMDIEGGEFKWIESLPLELLSSIRQMVIEFHDVQRSIECIEKLQLTHSLIHLHGNNYSPCIRIDNQEFPSVYEATFVRTSDFPDIKLSDKKYPCPFDSPNNPYKPEIDLSYL